MGSKIWKIIFYENSNGKKVIEGFIDKLDLKLQAKIFSTFDLLREFGIILSLPHVKKITGTDLWELRVLGKRSLRFFYISWVNRSFIVLHVFTKKTNKTPKKEIKIALKRLSDYKDRS